MSITALLRASCLPIILSTLPGTTFSSRAGEDPGPHDYKAHPVTATDPLAHTTWLGTGPGAAVDALGGGSPRPFAYKAYVRKPWLNPYERKGHQDVGGAGWTEPWTPDASETGAPTADWPARLKLDYGSPVAVAKLAVYFPVQGNGDSYLAPTAHAALLEAVEVLRSEDGRRWESAARIDRLPWTSPQVIEIPRPKPARHYILSVESMAPGNDALRIYEVETYTDPRADVRAEPVLPPVPEDPAPVLGGPERGEISCPGSPCRFELAGGGLELDLGDPGRAVRLSLALSPDARGAEGPWRPARGSEAEFAAPAAGGWARLRLETDALVGLRLVARMPPPKEGRARRFLYLKVKVPDPGVRFIPAHVWSTDAVRSAWPGHWLPTCMAAMETPAGTVALAPDSDGCRIGIQDDELTLCLFPDGGSASARLLLVPGGWWEAYRRVVESVDGFSGVRQVRPACEAAAGILRWLLLEKNWSDSWQMQRSFPATDRFYEEGEYFFIFYGQPYIVPALWQRFLLAGDERARSRLEAVKAFLLESPARVRAGPMAGGYYSTLAGTRGKYKLVDQAYNPWMTTQATGAALWSLLYHRALLGKEDLSLKRAIAETADCLLRIQKPDGGWAYAHREKDGTVPSGDFASSGSIWNVWALHRAGAALGNEACLEAARRGKDWWVRTFLEKHAYRGYWEDSNFKEVIYPTVEGYECSLAVQAFLEMGDEARAVEAARDLATWVQTRTPSYRDAATSLGHVPEQLTWPGNAYLAPQVGLALQEIRRRTEDPFWKPYASIPKAISWWCEPDTGAMFFPVEAAAFVPLDRGPLTRTYWGDWCGAQCASRTIWWLIDEINDRSAGLIAVDRDKLSGTVLGEPGKAWLPDDGPRVLAGEGHQLNWMGYLTESGFHLAVLNDEAAAPSRVAIRGREQVEPPREVRVRLVRETAREAEASPWPSEQRRLEIPPGALAIMSWTEAR